MLLEFRWDVLLFFLLPHCVVDAKIRCFSLLHKRWVKRHSYIIFHLSANILKTICGWTTLLRCPAMPSSCPSVASSMRSSERMSQLGRWESALFKFRLSLSSHCMVTPASWEMIFSLVILIFSYFKHNTVYSFDGAQVFKKEPTHFPFFFKCVMEAVLAGEEAGLTLKEQTVLLVFLDHCFNSLVCTVMLISICYFGNVWRVMLLCLSDKFLRIKFCYRFISNIPVAYCSIMKVNKSSLFPILKLH